MNEIVPAAHPAPRDWVIFSVLLAATIGTTYLVGGFVFSFSLLLILGTHEFGHYWASRRNNVKATLPFFIPAPPIFIAGTFGAFIQIKDQIPNRRVLIEIGAAGPIAGFVVAVPTLIVGLALSTTSAVDPVQGMSFGSSILLTVLSKLVLGITPLSPDINIELHPVAFAGWIGLLITALNLLPIGQLDGGHILYAMMGQHYHIAARVFFVLLLPLGYFWAGWWFWALMIALIGFRPAPLLDPVTNIGPRERRLGYLSLAIFIVTFIPIPFQAI